MSMLPKAQRVILQLIFEAAETGAPAPSVDAMRAACEAAHCSCTPGDAVNALADRKLIVVERQHKACRRFQYALSGKWTGWTAKRARGDGGDASVRAPKSDVRAGATIRPCITCSKPFESEGKHNRMCGGCKRLADNASPVALYGYGVCA